MLETIFASVTTKLAELCNSLHATANEQKEELHKLLDRMETTRAEIAAAGDMAEELAKEILEYADEFHATANKIEDAIEDPRQYLPECDYEDLAGWCEVCGDEVTLDEDYDESEDGDVVCHSCALHNQAE